MNYNAIAEEARAQAAGLEDRDEAARRRFDAIARIPRFPSLAPLHAQLAADALEPTARPSDPALMVAGMRWLLHLARAVGAHGVLNQIAELLEELEADGHGAHPQVSWMRALHKVAVAAHQRGYASGQEAYKIAASKAEALGDADLDIDLALARLDIEMRHDNGTATLQAIANAEDALEGRDSSWDGERYILHNARGLVMVQRDGHAETLEAMHAALALTLTHEVPLDEGQIMVGLAPALIHAGETDAALQHLDGAIERAVSAEAPGALEMPLRHLVIKVHEARRDLGSAIRAGFVAVERSGVNGSVDDYANFMVHVSALYYQAERHVDAYHMLMTAERGLTGRGDAPVLVARVSDLKDALRDDLGQVRYEAVVEEWKRREHS